MRIVKMYATKMLQMMSKVDVHGLKWGLYHPMNWYDVHHVNGWYCSSSHVIQILHWIANWKVQKVVGIIHG